LNATGLPSGVTQKWNPATEVILSPSGETESSNVTLTVPSSVSVGTKNFTITATNGKFIASTPASFVVSQPAQPSFSLTVNPSAQSIPEGTSANYTVGVVPANGFAGPVTLSIPSGSLPTGVTAQFTPATITNPATSVLQLSAASAAPEVANQSFSINGSSTPLSASLQAYVSVTAGSGGGCGTLGSVCCIGGGGGSCGGTLTCSGGTGGGTCVQLYSCANNCAPVVNGTFASQTACQKSPSCYPPLTMSAYPNPIDVGQTLTATSSGGVPPYTWSGAGLTDMTNSSQSGSNNEMLQGTYGFNALGASPLPLTVTDSVGQSTSANITLVAPWPSCTTPLSANPTQIVPPANSTLTWYCVNVKTCSISPSIGAVNVTNGTADGTAGVSVTPSQPTIYTLTCSGYASGSQNTINSSAFVNTNSPGGINEVPPGSH
jgi:hypothetical protein